MTSLKKFFRVHGSAISNQQSPDFGNRQFAIFTSDRTIRTVGAVYDRLL